MKAPEARLHVMAMRANAIEDEVARQLEQEIADEEDAGAEAVDLVAELEGARHLQLGEADIHPIEEGDEITQEEQRHDPPQDLAIGRAFEGALVPRRYGHALSPRRTG
ncbi:MAG: hypothetical protein J7498_11515 [Sphingobium sp.]|nr:hypothetical protein [Sphingobium sp.]